MTFFPAFASNLKTLRKKQRYSLSLLAKEAGLSKTYLWELEQDTEGTKSPSAYVVFRLSLLLGTDMESLLGLPKSNPKCDRCGEYVVENWSETIVGTLCHDCYVKNKVMDNNQTPAANFPPRP